MMKRPALLLLFILGAATFARSEPISREKTPEPLRPWIDWALYGHEEAVCPFFQGQGERRQCSWPSRLDLDLTEGSGRFAQEWLIFREEWVFLPGDSNNWPMEVHLDGHPAAVAPKDGKPAVRISQGRHSVAGRFAWDRLPPLIQVPEQTGLLRLTLRGRPVENPKRDQQGRLWLQKQTGPEQEENAVRVTVQRLVTDEIPLILTTRVELQISGESREVILGKALPGNFIPTALTGPLPARLDPDGRLRAQVRPGRFTLELKARHDGPAAAVMLLPPGGPWDQDEVWVFEARPDLRAVTIEGVAAIDPQQTNLPQEWRSMPAYLMKPGDTLRLAEKRRGDSDPAPDQLDLARNIWLDFDGKGFTARDQITGAMGRGWRLEMPAPAVLGRVVVNGADQFITRLGPSSPAGVEIRQGRVDLEADSRLEGKVSELAALGWSQDFHQVAAMLHLGPGWRLFHASGVDDVSRTWIASWTLLDLFLVLILSLSAFRLWGRWIGALALATLGLTWIETGAPRWAWVTVLTLEALGRALPAGRVGGLVKMTHRAAIVLLVFVCLPFLVQQVRVAIYPALEGESSFGAFGFAGPPPQVALQAEMVEEKYARDLPAEKMRGDADIENEAGQETGESSGVVGGGGLGGRVAMSDAKVSSMFVSAPPPRKSFETLVAHDPKAAVQTGPGLPVWSWRTVALRWRGPVEKGQRIHLMLIPPALNFFLAFIRVGLVAALLLVLCGLTLRLKRGDVGFKLRAGAWLVIGALLGAMPTPARAEIPPDAILSALRDRLLAPPECHPECASSPRLLLDAGPDRLQLRMELLAAAATAIPLPGGADQWTPDQVALDGARAAGLARTPDGRLWLEVGPGTHQVVLEGRLPERDVVDLPLPLRPHHVSASARGWRVVGLQVDGRPEETLQLIRTTKSSGAAKSLEAGELPPFVRIERDLILGITWQMRTRVARITPPGAAIVLEVPLLPGESVTTAEPRVVGDRALVTLGPSVLEVSWDSALRETPTLTLQASKAVPWVESWRLAAAPIWHVETDGIPLIHRPEETTRLREWRPWPGEKVGITVTRPEGIPGNTLTIDSSSLRVEPGLRATDVTLALTLRSSRGGQHPLVLPEGAALQSVTIDNVVQPIRQDGRKVVLPLHPGSETATLVWRESRGISLFFKGPAVDLGQPSVNATVQFPMPADRWTLLVRGPRLGPAVIFWGLLFVSLLVSAALGRSGLTPLRPRHWFLLSLGLTQSSLVTAFLIAAWLFSFSWRRTRPLTTRLSFNMRQCLLVVLTVAALVGLFGSIENGLLGRPEMQITGNDSSSSLLSWYADRTAELLPRPGVFSVPLILYRLAMLAWALWLAFALLRWLRWGWSCFTEGGVWRPGPPKRPTPPPAVPATGAAAR